MNVLSLFDGISCGRLALERAGIPVTNYYASEIEKAAITITQSNYPDTKQLGDVREVRGEDLPTIDLLLGGSPCQGFSRAGNRLNFEDPRSKLFFEFVRLLKECKPKYFLLENVKMKKDCEEIISDFLGVEPVEINSGLVSAQNRRRLYWTNIPNVTQPENKGLILEDILETEINEFSKDLKVAPEEKLVILGPSRSKYGLKCAGGLSTKKHLIGDREPTQYDCSQYNRIYSIEGKSPTIDCTSPRLITREIEKGYRRLTPIEYERLQTVPDNYTSSVAKTHRYKALGNSWTVSVISHILKNIS